jgi:hypothetical protein
METTVRKIVDGQIGLLKQITGDHLKQIRVEGLAYFGLRGDKDITGRQR